MKQSFRQTVRPWLMKHPVLYNSVRTTHRVYCKLTSPLHTLPDFIIIGAAKAGTSSLYDYLTQHPSIFQCIVKEPNYFAMYYDRGDEWYKSCFPSSFKKYSIENIKKEKFVTGEASTQYYWYPYAPKRAKKLIPKSKIIVLLRNPIDRAYSHYNMNVRGNIEKLSFENAIEKEHERIDEEYKKMLENENYFSPKYTAQAYLTKGIYINYIKNWMKYFPKEQFFIIKSENFYKNTNQVYNELLQFLGLSNYNLKRYDIIRKGSYDKMNSETRKKLVDFFKPYNEELYKFLGINFDWDK